MAWGRGNWGTRGVWGGTSAVVKADEVLPATLTLSTEQTSEILQIYDKVQNATLNLTPTETVEYNTNIEVVTPATLTFSAIQASELVETYNVIIALNKEQLIPIEFE